MTLTSEQSKAINALPKITPEDRDRLISALAEGRKPDELAAEYGKAVGTIYNFKTRWKAEIDDLRRARTVQFCDVAGTRKQARVDDLWDLRTAYKMLFKAHVESCYVTNPETGVQEFVESLVDWKKLRAYSSEVRASLKALMIETGQQLKLDDEWTEKALGLDGHNGVDYPAIVAGVPAREAAAEKRRLEEKWLELETQRRDLIDHEWKLEQHADVMQAKGYLLGEGERSKYLRQLRARLEGKTPVESLQAERQYQWGVGSLERSCEHIIAMDLERNPRELDHKGLEGMRVLIKEHFYPSDSSVLDQIDAFIDDRQRDLIMAKVFPDGIPDVDLDVGEDGGVDEEVSPPRPEPVVEPEPASVPAEAEVVVPRSRPVPPEHMGKAARLAAEEAAREQAGREPVFR